ncbi:hypothetical protein TNCV_1446561 [Trichonephila clavipes]|nr:hypothetical protein TNCV_1446561 [Trichonephila clavipes]
MCRKVKCPPVDVMWLLEEEWCKLRCRSRHLTMVQNDEVRHQTLRVAGQCYVNIFTHSLGDGAEKECICDNMSKRIWVLGY